MKFVKLAMEAGKVGYQVPQEFVEDNRDPLADIELTDSTELWLIQWPISRPAEFQGQEVSLNLNKDGCIGTFEGTSGKSYEVVSSRSRGPEVMVFSKSGSEAKIAGKISRRISLVHYPEPSELLLQRRNMANQTLAQRSSAATSTMSGRRLSTPRGSRPSSTPSGRTKSTITGSMAPSKQSKRKREDEQGRRSNDSAQRSGRGSAVTSSGSKGQSEERMTKKKKTSEN